MKLEKIKTFVTENKKVVAIVAIALLLAFIVIVSIVKHRVHYNTKPVLVHSIREVVEASGTINPVNSVSVGSTVSGLMKEIFVDFNSEVKAGQLIARMDTSLMQTDVDKGAATYANANANYLKQKAILDNEYKKYVRYSNLYKRNLIAKSELDAVESSYYSNKAALVAAKAQVDQSRATYNNAKTLLSFADIYSPVDGIIIKRAVNVGQPVAASFQAPELFVIAKDLKEMQIEVNVSEADINKILEGQEVDYSIDGSPDKIFKGKVSQVRLSPTTVSNVVTYTVIVRVKNDDGLLKPGMSANVSIITKEKENVLCVPNESLKYVVPSKDGKPQKYDNPGVWVLKNNRKPERINVTFGLSDDNYTEVISDEIKEGDKVVLPDNVVKKTGSPHRMPRMM